MGRRLAIIQGHLDPRVHHVGHALADAYTTGAEAAGHEVRVIEVARLNVPVLRTKEDWENDAPPDPIRQPQQTIGWAQHLVIVYPLWLSTMPTLVKAFLEQVFRPGFALAKGEAGQMGKKLLTGKSTRIVVNMGMPAWVYCWYFRAHRLKSRERNMLQCCGIGPITESLFGMVEAPNPTHREKWLEHMRRLGRDGR